MREFVKADSLVIDMGCGNGRDCRYLNLFNDVVGVDQSDEVIEFCRTQSRSMAETTKTLDVRVLSIEDENIYQIDELFKRGPKGLDAQFRNGAEKTLLLSI